MPFLNGWTLLVHSDMNSPSVFKLHNSARSAFSVDQVELPSHHFHSLHRLSFSVRLSCLLGSALDQTLMLFCSFFQPFAMLAGLIPSFCARLSCWLWGGLQDIAAFYTDCSVLLSKKAVFFF